MHGSTTNNTPGNGSGDALAYRVPQAAQLIGLGERKTWQLVLNGSIESVKVGSARLITRDALQRFIASLPKA